VDKRCEFDPVPHRRVSLFRVLNWCCWSCHTMLARLVADAVVERS
jgi:hypothetical protein